MPDGSRFERESLIQTLYPLRGYFGKAGRAPEDVEGVVFRCVDRRLPDVKQSLGLGEAYFVQQEPGAAIHAPERGNKSIESAMGLGLAGNAKATTPPHSVVVLGHDDCKAALIGLQDLLEPGSARGMATSVADHMRGLVHPQLAAALGTSANVPLGDLHKEMIRSTVLSSMLNASHYRLGDSPTVETHMDRGQAQIIGGIEGLKSREPGKTLIYHGGDFRPLEELYHNALGGNQQMAGEIEEAMQHQLAHGGLKVHMGAKSFLADMEAGIRNQLARIEALKIR